MPSSMLLPANTDQADKWEGWLYIVLNRFVCDASLTFKANQLLTNAKAKELSPKAGIDLTFLPP